MRRFSVLLLVLALFAACKPREQRAWDPESLDAPVKRPGKVDRRTGRYIPPVCAADGSYEQARACFLKSEVVRFRTADGMGTLTREAPGRESMMLYVARGPLRGRWRAMRAGPRVYWSLNQGGVRTPPPQVARIFDLVSRFPDPPKREGKPRLVSRDDKAVTWEFTAADSGERWVVRLHVATGHLLELTAGAVSLRFG